jgi:hypothetical protein
MANPIAFQLTTAVSCYYGLFAPLKKVKSFVIKKIRTLFAKHPGWGAIFSRHSQLLHSIRCSDGFTCRFSLALLFSFTYKTLFSQPLSFHIDTKPPGVGVTMTKFQFAKHVLGSWLLSDWRLQVDCAQG